MKDSRYTKLIDRVILEQLGKGETFTFKVTGDSMHPLIRRGDRAHIQGCNPRDLSAGDIITFRNDDLYITHRLLWTRTRGNVIELITKGDNEITIDPPVSPTHIIGKVIAIGRADRTIRLEALFWRFVNRLLRVFSLAETISLLLYRHTVAKFHPSKPRPAKLKPTHLSR
jgi:signal peptidase I